MREVRHEMDIAKNIKSIEYVKTELLDNVAGLFRGLLKGNETVMLDYLANIIVSSYVLGRRLGIDYSELDRHLHEKIQRGIDMGHQVEQWYGDLSTLQKHVGKGQMKEQ